MATQSRKRSSNSLKEERSAKRQRLIDEKLISLRDETALVFDLVSKVEECFFAKHMVLDEKEREVLDKQIKLESVLDGISKERNEIAKSERKVLDAAQIVVKAIEDEKAVWESMRDIESKVETQVLQSLFPSDLDSAGKVPVKDSSQLIKDIKASVNFDSLCQDGSRWVRCSTHKPLSTLMVANSSLSIFEWIQCLKEGKSKRILSSKGVRNIFVYANGRWAQLSALYSPEGGAEEWAISCFYFASNLDKDRQSIKENIVYVPSDVLAKIAGEHNVAAVMM